MLHVIAIILSILFIVILIVSIIVFTIINGKSNTGDKPNISNIKDEKKAEFKVKEIRRKSRRHSKRSKSNKSSKSTKSEICDQDAYSDLTSETSNILDVCNYSKYTIYLMTDHSIRIQDNDQGQSNLPKDIKTNLRVTSITSFEGHLYALANGRLYKLDNNTLENSVWHWNRITWSPENILDISVPHNKNFIWVRCRDYGYLYDINGQIVDTVKEAKKRIYGPDENSYITIDNNIGVLYPNNQIYKGIKDAIITHDGELYTLNLNDKYKMIKIIDWKPYYIM